MSEIYILLSKSVPSGIGPCRWVADEAIEDRVLSQGAVWDGAVVEDLHCASQIFADLIVQKEYGESYRRGTTMDLGYLSSAWRMATNSADGNLVLSSMLDPTSLRCGSGALCDERGGACPDCILIPEVCCITRNNLLSRSVLRGMAKPHWDVAIPRDQNIEGYFEVVRRMRRMAEQRNAAA